MKNEKSKRAEQLASQPGICWTDEPGTYLVPSQSGQRKYVVRNRGYQWTCTCPYSLHRKESCKHILAARIWLEKQGKIVPRPEPAQEKTACPFCKSTTFIKDGTRKTAFILKQRYRCACGGRFTAGIVKHIKGDEQALLMTMHLFYSGQSLRKIQTFLSQFHGLTVDHSTLYRWIEKFQKIIIAKVSKIQPEISATWHADEQEIKVRGKYVYCWNLIDRETRFLIATNVTKGRYISDARKLFHKSKKVVSGKPQYVITDGLAAYSRAIKKEFHSHRVPRVSHLPMAGVSKKHNNNLIERYHNTFRERDKVMRGFHSVRSAQRFADGFRLYNNFIRSNMALGGVTPAQAAGIGLGYAKNRWHELLAKSVNGDFSSRHRVPRRAAGYVLRAWYQSGREARIFQHQAFKTRFESKEKAKEYLDLYMKRFPHLVFFVERNTI